MKRHAGPGCRRKGRGACRVGQHALEHRVRRVEHVRDLHPREAFPVEVVDRPSIVDGVLGEVRAGRLGDGQEVGELPRRVGEDALARAVRTGRLAQEGRRLDDGGQVDARHRGSQVVRRQHRLGRVGDDPGARRDGRHLRGPQPVVDDVQIGPPAEGGHDGLGVGVLRVHHTAERVLVGDQHRRIARLQGNRAPGVQGVEDLGLAERADDIVGDQRAQPLVVVDGGRHVPMDHHRVDLVLEPHRHLLVLQVDLVVESVRPILIDCYCHS